MDEEPERPPHHGVRDRLDEWREAERDAEAEAPDSAARKMARKRADAARRDFHEAEDVEREYQGNHRPRKQGQAEEPEERSAGGRLSNDI